MLCILYVFVYDEVENHLPQKKKKKALPDFFMLSVTSPFPDFLDKAFEDLFGLWYCGKPFISCLLSVDALLVGYFQSFNLEPVGVLFVCLAQHEPNSKMRDSCCHTTIHSLHPFNNSKQGKCMLTSSLEICHNSLCYFNF